MGIKRETIKDLTQKELQEICARYELKGFSGLKQPELIKFVCENLEVPEEEIQSIVNTLREDKLVNKINDSGDYFITKQVHILYGDKSLIKANVGGYEVKIENLGKENFDYICDQKCHDWLYQVKKGRYPFCKHYPAVLAQLIFEGQINVDEVRPNHIEGKVLSTLISMVEKRKKEEGLIFPPGRKIQERLKNIDEDLFKISMQDQILARNKYHEVAEMAFETLVGDAFLLLEFEIIPKRKTTGWDLLILGTHAYPPFIAVAECKTAADGVYEQVLRNPNYLQRLKEYCMDLRERKLVGTLSNYVKYMVMVAPGFPLEVNSLCEPFAQMTGGIRLSFLPVKSLIKLVKTFREEPIITHPMIERLFQRGSIITEEDIDTLLREALEHISELVVRCKKALRERMKGVLPKITDSSFIKLDSLLFQDIWKTVLGKLEPDIVRSGKKEAVGVETISIMHDYYDIWRRVLDGLVEEFVSILKFESEQRVKRTELKEEILTLLELVSEKEYSFS